MNFLKLFQESNFQPIVYNGKIIIISDTLPTENIKLYEVNFTAVKSEWEQGIFFHSKKAHFRINNQRESLNAFHLWHSESLKTNVFEILKGGSTELKIWNIWRINSGPMSYGTNGGAMHKEDIENGRTYYCNDGYPDDDFDDLVFDVRWFF